MATINEQALAIDTANEVLNSAGLPDYDDVVDALRAARALLAHANTPTIRTVQRIDVLLARVEDVAVL